MAIGRFGGPEGLFSDKLAGRRDRFFSSDDHCLTYMSTHATDPDLNILARKLKTLEWIHPLDADEIEACVDMTLYQPGLNPGDGPVLPKRKFVHPMAGATNWAVRLCLGGAQRTLGIVDQRHVEDAFRFADMAQQYFWKYKLRGAAPPTEADFNISKERVDGDMVAEENALALLKAEEEYMLSMGIIKTAADRHAEYRQRKEESRKTRVRAMVQVNHMECLERFDALSGQMDTVMRDNAALLARIEKLDASLAKALTGVFDRLPKSVYTGSPITTTSNGNEVYPKQPTTGAQMASVPILSIKECSLFNHHG
jgi:hypothetical protein